MKKVIIITFIVILIVFAYSLGKSGNRTPSAPSGGLKKVFSCTRTERYKNLPEFERALSLIDQRFSSSQADTTDYTGKLVKEKDYWHNLLPCIVVQYGDIKDLKGAEGYFLFNSDQVKPDYLPVYVDKSYSQVDDVTLALLLVHEITHAAQYLYDLNGTYKFTCYSAETAAFTSQWNLLMMLNVEERKNIEARLSSNSDHPQLQIIKSMVQSYWTHKNECGVDDFCAQRKVVTDVESMVKNNPFYQKECSSN